VNDESAARRLGRALREHRESELSPQARQVELARLLRTVRAVGKPARVRRGVWTACGLTMTALAAAALLALRPARELTYEVRGVARIEATSVSAEAGEPVQLRFSDGSRVELAPGARMRVEGRTPGGAALLLLEGNALAAVAAGARSHVRLRAGPFAVRAMKARFLASYDRGGGRLTIALYEGSAEVAGGPLHEPVVLHGGQRFEGDTRGQAVRIAKLVADVPKPVEPPTRAPEPAFKAHPTLPSAAAPSATATSVHPPSWSTLLTRSEFGAIVEQARAMGVERCFSACSPKNLRILADAARYVGDGPLAEHSLLALRRRSPAEAWVTDFFLARLYESQGRSAEALTLYERNLREAPRGDYAEQAAAGRMRMLLELGQRVRARDAAQAYLTMFPAGVHTAFAARLLESKASP
jgi:hypothetical protein